LIWKELLIDLDFEYFRNAVIKICKENVDFYPGTNIPGKIREEAKNFKSESAREENSFKKKFEQYKEEAASPEEVKEILKQIGFRIQKEPSGDFI
tara:strand:+ start:1123 stop:1407 length:285 start_codon:yes stop_codon:yes gene_type:complete